MEIEDEIKYWQEHKDEYWEEINKEYWKKIEGWNYSISTEGRYRNDKTGKILKSSLNKNINLDNGGYYQMHLCENNKKKWPLTHRQVAITFIPNLNNYTDVNHKDPHNRHDNSITNLEWVPHVENCLGVNTKKGACGYIRFRKEDNLWEARLRFMGKPYSFCKKDKNLVEKWLDNRRNEIKNKMPLTELTEPKCSKGSIKTRGKSYRARIQINNKEYTGSFKNYNDAEIWLENIRANLKI